MPNGVPPPPYQQNAGFNSHPYGPPPGDQLFHWVLWSLDGLKWNSKNWDFCAIHRKNLLFEYIKSWVRCNSFNHALISYFIIAPVHMRQPFSAHPTVIVCHQCNATVLTRTITNPSSLTHIAALLLCLFG